jgi:hypothetical protein
MCLIVQASYICGKKTIQEGQEQKSFYLLKLECKDFLIYLVDTGQQLSVIPYICDIHRPLSDSLHTRYTILA